MIGIELYTNGAVELSNSQHRAVERGDGSGIAEPPWHGHDLRPPARAVPCTPWRGHGTNNQISTSQHTTGAVPDRSADLLALIDLYDLWLHT